MPRSQKKALLIVDYMGSGSDRPAYKTQTQIHMHNFGYARSTRSIGLCDGRWRRHGLHSEKIIGEFIDLGVEAGQFVSGPFIT